MYRAIDRLGEFARKVWLDLVCFVVGHDRQDEFMGKCPYPLICARCGRTLKGK